MKIVTIAMLCVLPAYVSQSAEIVVQQVRGDVLVRSGAAEEWTTAKTGAILKPKDTMRTGRKGSAVLVIRSESDPGATRKISVPPEVILDLSDVRDLSQEELMMKLTMEKVRSSSYEWKRNDLQIPNATVVHGDKPASSHPVTAAELEQATLQMNGTRVLFKHKFYSTCALKAVSIMNRFPSLGNAFEDRIMVAESLERSNLYGEALSEYMAIAASTTLTQKQQSLVQLKIDRLKKEG